MTTAIISTLIGGLLALAGAFVGPFLQRKHDRWMARRADHQILREKAEELFSELDTFVTQSGRASIRIIERLVDENLETIVLPDIGKVRALSTVYFPRLLIHLDQFQADIRAVFKKIAPELGDAGKALDAKKIKGWGAMMAIEHQEIAIKLVDAVRREMIEISPKFEEIV